MLKGNTVIGILTAMLLLPAGAARAQAVISEEAKATQAGFNLLQVYSDIEQLEYEIQWQDSVCRKREQQYGWRRKSAAGCSCWGT